MATNTSISEYHSFWEYQHYFIDVDYTIVGCGIVGISTAISLKQADPSLKVLVIDKKSIPVGASTKNAGFACFGSVSEIVDDIALYGVDTAAKLINMRRRGLAIMRGRLGDEKINYQAEPGKEIFRTDKEAQSYISRIDDINKFVENSECKSVFREENGRFGRTIVNEYEGSINPQKMMHNLELMARNLGVLFCSGIRVLHIDSKSQLLQTNRGDIAYNKLVICTNGFTADFVTDIDLVPARNQVIVTKPMPGFSLDGCYHLDRGYVYFREVAGRLILGGGRNLDLETETISKLGANDKILDYLKSLASEVILQGFTFEIDMNWSGILGVGTSKMPILKYVDPHVFMAVRMGGMGVAIGSYIGQVASSILLDLDNSDHQLYVSS